MTKAPTNSQGSAPKPTLHTERLTMPRTENTNSLSDLVIYEEIGDIIDYARQAADELIAECKSVLADLDEADPDDDLDVARLMSADALESRSSVIFDIDPSLMQLLIETTLCEKLNCRESDICAEY